MCGREEATKLPVVLVVAVAVQQQPLLVLVVVVECQLPVVLLLRLLRCGKVTGVDGQRRGP